MFSHPASFILSSSSQLQAAGTMAMGALRMSRSLSERQSITAKQKREAAPWHTSAHQRSTCCVSFCACEELRVKPTATVTPSSGLTVRSTAVNPLGSQLRHLEMAAATAAAAACISMYTRVATGETTRGCYLKEAHLESSPNKDAASEDLDSKSDDSLNSACRVLVFCGRSSDLLVPPTVR